MGRTGKIHRVALALDIHRVYMYISIRGYPHRDPVRLLVTMYPEIVETSRVLSLAREREVHAMRFDSNRELEGRELGPGSKFAGNFWCIEPLNANHRYAGKYAMTRKETEIDVALICLIGGYRGSPRVSPSDKRWSTLALYQLCKIHRRLSW